MVPILLNILLAGIPGIGVLVYFLRRDQRRKSSGLFVWRAFALGFASLLPAAGIELLLAALPLSLEGIVSNLFRAYVVSGFVEEGITLLVVVLFICREPYFVAVSDGIIYAITASMGLAFFENILYGFGTIPELLVRGFTAVPLHAVSSGIMGYFIGKTQFGDRPLLARGLLAAVAVHGTYNLLLFSGGWLSFMVFPLLLIFGVLLFRLYRIAITEDINEERIR